MLSATVPNVPKHVARFSKRVRRANHTRRDPKTGLMIYLHEDQLFALHKIAATQGFPNPDLYLQSVVRELTDQMAAAVIFGAPNPGDSPDELELELRDLVKDVT